MRTPSAFLLLALAATPSAQAQWATLAPMPTPRSGAAVAVYGGQVYVMGGRNAAGQIVDTVERYDPATGQWASAPRLRDARTNAAAVVVGNELIITGGRDDENEVTDDSEVFDPSDNRWESFSNLRFAREGHAAFAVSGYGYAFGGSSPGGAFRGDAEVYDPADGNWRDYVTWQLAIPRASFASAPVGAGVLVMGGYSTFGTLSDVEFYVPGTGASMRPSLPAPRGGLAAAAVTTGAGTRVYAIGGRSGAAVGAVSAEVYVYDPAATNGAWTTGPALPAPREAAAAVAIGPHVYVIGGRDAYGVTTGTAYRLDTTTTPAEEGPGEAGGLALAPPAPNPTAGPARLALTTAAADPVRVTVYDALGRRVAVLHEGPLAAGTHALDWDGRDEAGRPVAAGLYLVRAEQDGRAAVRRLTVAR